ncbi:MAG: ZIP family metal transporter [Armatimonadota bacterium]
MLQLTLYSVLAGAATLAGAIAVLLRRTLSGKVVLVLMGFGAGVLLSAAFLHLIPDAALLSANRTAWALLGSFLAFYAIEQGVSARLHVHELETHYVGRVGVMAFIALFIHSLVDGLGIASTLRISPELGFTTALAVVAHEVPEGIVSVALFTAGGFNRRLVFGLAAGVALATPLGAFASWFWTAGLAPSALAALIGVAAGSFLYVAAVDLLPVLHEKRDPAAFAALLAGVAVPIALLFIE